MQSINYDTLERIVVDKPVDRIGYIEELCKNKFVLDLGCYDETAIGKMGTEYWLHGRVARVARLVVGLDSSDIIPEDGIYTMYGSKIYKGNAFNIPRNLISDNKYDVIVAGELIEHLENPLMFLVTLKETFKGKRLLLTTPNAVCLANSLMGIIGREAQHKDHLANFSYKILNTLCIRAGFKSWSIRPYRFYATEMILGSKGSKKRILYIIESFIRFFEWLFPLLSFGYILVAEL